MKTVFFDIDTQFDFLYPSGALYAPNAERVVPAVARLNRFAAARGIPVISTVDAHAENDPEFAVWPPHCVTGTLGQRKPEQTLVDKRVTVANRPGLIDVSGACQVIVEKQTVEPLHALNMPALLEQLGAERYVVYGVVTEVCVINAVRELFKTGKPVTVVADAVEAFNAPAGTRAFDEIRAGGALTTLSEICGA